MALTYQAAAGKLGHLLCHLFEDNGSGIIREFLQEGQMLVIRQSKVTALIRYGFFDVQADDLFCFGFGQSFQSNCSLSMV